MPGAWRTGRLLCRRCERGKTAIETVRLAIETFGKVDILINNAGIGRVLSLTDTSMEEYDLIMNSNVRSAFAFTKHTDPGRQTAADLRQSMPHRRAFSEGIRRHHLPGGFAR